jgi:hypothetical protein
MAPRKGTVNNPAGRPAGSPNKSTDQLRNVFQTFLSDNIENLQRDFDSLEARERVNFILKIANLVLPPPLQLENLTDAQLDQLIEKLKETNSAPVVRKANIYVDADDVNL